MAVIKTFKLLFLLQIFYLQNPAEGMSLWVVFFPQNFNAKLIVMSKILHF